VAYFAPLLVLAFWIGMGPKPFFTILERSVANVVERVQPGYYTEHGQFNPLLPAELQPGVRR